MVIFIANGLLILFAVAVAVLLQNANKHNPSYDERIAAKWISS